MRVERVKPVNILDFGCGFGYVGLLLLPILPKGSTYTGIDISETLLNEAENIFANSGYPTKFIKVDLNEYEPEENYDIAISQAVLRHIPNAENILEKMIRSVVPNGLVICMEKSLNQREAEMFVNGNLKINEYVMSNKDNVYIIQAPCALISYGTK